MEHENNMDKKKPLGKEDIEQRNKRRKTEAINRSEAMGRWETSTRQSSNGLPQASQSLSSHSFPSLPARGILAAKEPHKVENDDPANGPETTNLAPTASRATVSSGLEAVAPLSTPEAMPERPSRGMEGLNSPLTISNAVRKGPGNGTANSNVAPTAPASMRERPSRDNGGTKLAPPASTASQDASHKEERNGNITKATGTAKPDPSVAPEHLRRAFWLVGQILFLFRKTTSRFVATEVEEIDGELCFATYAYPCHNSDLYWTGDAYMHYPASSIRARDMFAIAALCNSYWIMATFEPIISLWLRDICASLEVCTIFPTDGPRHAVETCYGQAVEFRGVEEQDHIVIKATLQDGSIWGYDPTCLQYGWKPGVLPWEVFSAERIKSSSAPLPLEGIRRRWDLQHPLERSHFKDRRAEAIRNAERKIVHAMLTGLKNRLQMRALTAAHVLTIDRHYFKPISDELFKDCNDHRNWAMGELRQRGKFTRGYIASLPGCDQSDLSYH
ncbi:hypothetical protein FKW77_005343 [Venturia effusa]|uniref:Uncharacterized protein n=1 Tax=Venturia effusa TaxID=50376 RepID=A0A517L1C3_9PEZI|nr:hypothetical protein FKW77_005343 [Venturia effusa]